MFKPLDRGLEHRDERSRDPALLHESGASCCRVKSELAAVPTGNSLSCSTGTGIEYESEGFPAKEISESPLRHSQGLAGGEFDQSLVAIYRTPPIQTPPYLKLPRTHRVPGLRVLIFGLMHPVWNRGSDVGHRRRLNRPALDLARRTKRRVTRIKNAEHPALPIWLVAEGHSSADNGTDQYLGGSDDCIPSFNSVCRHRASGG